MIGEIKRIKTEELNKKILENKRRKEGMTVNLQELEKKYEELKQDQTIYLVEYKSFSFVERFITKRDEYREYKEKTTRMKEHDQAISDVFEQMMDERKRVEEQMQQEGIDQKIEDAFKKITAIQNAKTLEELGFSTIDAIKFLEDRGIQPVLTDADKYIIDHSRNYFSKSSMMGVHKTKYAPTDNVIKSAKAANSKLKKEIILNGVEYEYSYKRARDTVHMAMNDEVSSHAYGSWDDCRYAVLIPFKDIPNERIGSTAPMDTFIKGSLDLTEDSWILCPENEVDHVKAHNPKVHVLGYKGENVTGYSQPFLTHLGYRAESVGMWNWADDESANQFLEFTQKEGLPTGAHTYTHFHEDEQTLTDINQAMALIKLLRDNKLITKQKDVENIMSQIQENQFQNFGNILSCLVEGSMIEKNDADPEAIKANNKQVDIFLEEMKTNGFNIPQVYQNIIRNLSEVTLNYCDSESKDKVFNITAETSKREKNVIEELQSVLASDKYVNYNEKKDAFGKFISTIIGDSILHSQEKDSSKKEVEELEDDER